MTLDALRVAFSLHDFAPLLRVDPGVLTEASHIQQAHIARGLAARGHAVTLFGPRGLDEILVAHGDELERPAAVTWTGTPGFDAMGRLMWRAQRLAGIPYLNMFRNWRLRDAATQTLAAHDLVLDCSGLWRAGVARASRSLGLPYVVLHDADSLFEYDVMGERITGLLRWRATRLFRESLAAADRIICVAKASRDRLVAVWGVEPASIEVVPNGVDVDRFHPDADARAAVRAALGWTANPLIVFAGAFFPWQDVACLLRAFAVVRREEPAARLALVGDGRCRVAMVQLATALGLADQVGFVGRVPHADVPGFLAAADVLVAPMTPNAWGSPTKVREYLATGGAVVASRSGELGEVVRHESNGLLVEPGAPAGLAAALLALIRSPALRERLGRQAREDAVREHAWPVQITRLEEIQRDVLARRRRQLRPARLVPRLRTGRVV